MTRLRVVASVASLMLAGCLVGPDYVVPTTPVPPRYSAVASEATDAGAADPAPALAQWWRAFKDPLLDGLIASALADNLDIRSAGVRIQRARAQLEGADAELFPSVSATGSYQRYRIPDALRDLASQQQAPVTEGFQVPKTLKAYRAGFDASWELDWWGGTRRAIQAAQAAAEAAWFARRGAVVSTLAEVGNEYASLRATQARVAIAQRRQASEEQLLALTRDRQQHGFASDLESAQARAQLETTRAQLPPLQAQSMQHIHALAILLGRLPESMEQELGASSSTLVAPPEVPVGLPSTLLANRPDIRQADRQLAAATAQVGVATARRLPSLSLTAGAGYASGALKDLLKADSRSWNESVSLTAPLLDFGRLAANQDEARAAMVEASLQYRQTVLRAFQDVEDGLQAHTAARLRQQSLSAANDAGRLALQRSTEQFKAGLASYLAVLDADRSLAAAEDQLALADQTQIQQLIRVYKALGGGWQAGELLEPIAAEAAAARLIP